MKKLLTAVALAALAVGAQAQVTYSGGTPITSISNYNPNGSAASLVPAGGLENASLSTSAGLLTATFLGYEADDIDNYTFSTTLGTLSNRSALNATIAGYVSAGALSFTFTDTSTGTTVGNGGSSGPYTSYSVLGSFNGSVFTPYTMGGLYDVILGFNDGLRVDADYDDMVVGLRVAAVPEPETYALMLAGLGAIGFIGRRRKKTLAA